MDNIRLEKMDLNDDETLKYRLQNMTFSQNALKTWKRSREEFVQKYILGMVWSSGDYESRMYDRRMERGREFHLVCERIFTGIYDGENIEKLRDITIDGRNVSDSLINIMMIKDAYTEKYGNDAVFYPEYTIELENRVLVRYDLLIMIYERDSLKKIEIWDWKTETKKIDKEQAKFSMQTMVYTYAAKKSIGEVLDFSCIEMNYYQPFIENRIRITLDEEMFRNNERIIERDIESIMSLDMNSIFKTGSEDN